ncbi:V-type ATPase subunit [Ruminococcaceae bacterium OttesenSCG-928-I18]|nr:V-type ATPase subunit [Ruminococcaceae bacterium OttesenSCG-928-I18]
MENGTQAIIPKARGMYAKRLSNAEYEEMMRRRTVPEVAAILRRHPYFERSLATLTSDPHRGQIEELLNRDIFKKYEELIHYDFEGDSFSEYYVDECEVDELLRRIYLFSIGIPQAQPSMVSEHLVGHVRIDLYALAEVTSFEEAVEVAKKYHSPYYRVLQEHYNQDPALKDFPLLEARMWNEYYRLLFKRIDDNFSGREKQQVSRLFLQQIESYNVELLLRVKTFFPQVYEEEELRGLLQPYRYRISRVQMNKLIKAPTPEAFIQYYRQLPFVPSLISSKPDEFMLTTDQHLFLFTQRVLRMSASPFAVLAAFLLLAKLQKDNVVNIIEGVRYKMPPEEIGALLRR